MNTRKNIFLISNKETEELKSDIIFVDCISREITLGPGSDLGEISTLIIILGT